MIMMIMIVIIILFYFNSFDFIFSLPFIPSCAQERELSFGLK